MEHAKKLLKEELAGLQFLQESNYVVLKKDSNHIVFNKLSIKDFIDQVAKKIEDIEIALKVLELFEVVDDVKLNINE
jgi:hypothetical protein